MTTMYSVGQQVEFHSEWPFETVYGTVLAVGTRPREFGPGMETCVTVRWERSATRSEGISGVQTWNTRLQPRVE